MNMDSFFAMNFSPIVGMAFLCVFLCLNERLGKNLKRLFFLLLVMEVIELFVYNVELMFAVQPAFSYWRVFLSAVGYSIRPALIYMILQFALRNPMTKTLRILMALPLILNVVAVFSAFWTNIVFSYTESNQFVRGPLGYITHVCLIFYLLIFVVGTLAQMNRREMLESVIMMGIFCLLTGSVIIEAIWSVRSIGRTAMVLSTIFYYMFFQTREYQKTLATEEMIREQLKMQANTDQVTGLLNKTAFLQRLTQALNNQSKEAIVLVFFDLDHFKNLNDTLGHSMGDKALQDVGDILRRTFGGEDCFGRFGGDEFCVMLQVNSTELLARKLHELQSALRRTYTQGKHTVRITASIGAAIVSPGVFIDTAHLLETADAAAYAVKKAGRDGCKIVTL